MPSNDELPEFIRNEFIRLRQSLKDLRAQYRGITPDRKPMRAQRSVLKKQIAETKDKLKVFIRQYGESDKEAESRVQNTAAGDPMHLERPVAHSRLYGHGIVLDRNPCGDTQAG